jgi:hypothetical protein
MAATASAGIWTQIPSGTAEDISAVDYQGGDRFWLATAGGSIRYREGGVFKPANLGGAPSIGLPFNDIAFKPGTNIGLAVGNANNVWRSTDGGRNWTKLAGLTTVDQNCFSPGAGSIVPIGDMFTIAWGPNNVVYLGGDNKTVLRSNGTDGASFASVNTGSFFCRMNVAGVTDIFFFPIATSRADEKLYFQDRDSFGKIWFTSDGLTSNAVGRAGSNNGLEKHGNLAVDPSNTNRLWSTDECGFTCLYRSIDGGANFECVCRLVNENSENQIAWFDIEYAGGTVLVAGRGGQIANSTDGVDFFYNKADGALATHDWYAVGLASASAAAIGGQGGALVVTSTANKRPDIAKPTGLIAGPNAGVAGQALTFTAQVADEAGGSGIDPAGYQWTSTGLPTTGGAAVTYRFPNPGFFTVRLTFRDRAGNVAEAFKSVQISAPLKPTFSFTGPGNTATAKIIGRFVRIRARGTIKPPAGVPVAAACTGKVRLTIKRKRTTIAKARARLRVRNGKCRFGKTLFIRRGKVGRATRLRLKVRFPGNAALQAGSVTKTLVVRK